ncbi:FHA domain-containing protein FhaB/FipA [Kocuria sp. HSID16901]|uniref:FHA domain-containing protein FhaB/FipA n=1 Tax=Kocuria sp. HSID16901 TaxID=2419505 RepID=UPI00065FDB7B|nr:FHA domain-containing protein [Kocuria sp. HSID16901]RUQ19858.1 FHA domain-containing protein [Kocuria sp. HSID16901]
MASELTVTLLRFGFLALLWVFIFVILAGQRRDLGIGQTLRFTSLPGRRRKKSSSKAPTTTGSQKQQAPKRPSRLTIVQGPGSGTILDMGESPVMLGRAQDCTLPLDDDYCSGHHARLFPQGSRWFLEDLGSTNGIFVNGQRLTRASLIEPGVQFTVGRTVFELRP